MGKMIGKYRKAKGFTLVELLIVIIIIGILAGMMMLSSGSATDKAEATKIVSDMRNVKSGALMCYADTGTWPTAIESIDKYLDVKVSGTDSAFSLTGTGTGTAPLFVAYDGANGAKKIPTANNGVAEKLKLMAADAGLYANGTSADLASTPNYVGGTKVYMVIKK